MNLRHSPVVILLLITNIMSSQDIMFYSKYGKATIEKKAAYFETMVKVSDNQFLLIRQRMDKDTISVITYSSLSPLTRDGITKIFYESGAVHYLKNYRNNKLDGKTIRYYEDGRVKSMITLNTDSVISQKSFDKYGNEINYIHDVVYPKFKNKSIKQFSYYLSRYIDYPPIARDQNLSASVGIEFAIDENGHIQIIEVQSDIHDFRKEIYRCIQSNFMGFAI